MGPIQVSFDIGPYLPQVLLAAGGIVLLVLSFWRRAESLAPALTLATLAAAGWACARAWSTDPFTHLFELILLAAAALSCLISVAYLGGGSYELRGEYYAMLVFATLGMTVMAGARNFVTLFLGLETFSIALYLLAAFTRNRVRALESSMKYFLLGAFSSGFILYGMALVYGATGTLDLVELGGLLAGRQAEPGLTLLAGLGLLVVGLGFKIGIVPFHFWIPDVYEGAPASVTAYMAAATKVAAFAALLRVLHVGFGIEALAARWVPLLGMLSALTMTVANIVALTQRNLKRLLAYSSIAHAGYLLLAVATNTLQGVESLTFYLVAYVFANLGAFAVAVLVGQGDAEAEVGYRVADLAGLGRRRPWMAAAMTVFLLSLTGIPPTAGFLAKWFIFRSALDAGLLGLAVVLAVNSAIAAYYYLGIVVQMYMAEPQPGTATPPLPLSLAASAAVAVAATFYLGLFPSRTLQLLTDVAHRFWSTLHSI